VVGHNNLGPLRTRQPQLFSALRPAQLLPFQTLAHSLHNRVFSSLVFSINCALSRAVRFSQNLFSQPFAHSLPKNRGIPPPSLSHPPFMRLAVHLPKPPCDRKFLHFLHGYIPISFLFFRFFVPCRNTPRVPLFCFHPLLPLNPSPPLLPGLWPRILRHHFCIEQGILPR